MSIFESSNSGGGAPNITSSMKADAKSYAEYTCRMLNDGKFGLGKTGTYWSEQRQVLEKKYYEVKGQCCTPKAGWRDATRAAEIHLSTYSTTCSL